MRAPPLRGLAQLDVCPIVLILQPTSRVVGNKHPNADQAGSTAHNVLVVIALSYRCASWSPTQAIDVTYSGRFEAAHNGANRTRHAGRERRLDVGGRLKVQWRQDDEEIDLTLARVP